MKFTALLLILVLAAGLWMTGCSSADDDADNQLKKDVYDLYESLQTVIADVDSGYDVTEYLYDWGETHGFVSRSLSGGNVIITRPASLPDPSFPYTIIQCSLDPAESKASAQKAAIAMAALLNVRENGKVSVLFTLRDGGNYTGARRINASLLDADYFINLDLGESGAILTGTAGYTACRSTLPYKTAAPSTTKAYKITISGLPGGDASGEGGLPPNPIVILSSLLTVNRANGLLLELADFGGGTSGAVYPSQAYAVVCLEQNSETRFLNRVASNQESFYDKYGKDYPDASYTFEEVALPSSVVASDDASRILSLLYTSKNGVARTSESDGGDVLALANMGRLKLSGGVMTLDLGLRCLTDSLVPELLETYKASAYLSQATFKVLSETPGWPSAEETPLADLLDSAAADAGLKNLSVKAAFTQSECAVFYEKKKDIPMISFLVNNTDSFPDAKALVLFLTNLVHES
jgi:dipeptidase D